MQSIQSSIQSALTQQMEMQMRSNVTSTAPRPQGAGALRESDSGTTASYGGAAPVSAQFEEDVRRQLTTVASQQQRLETVVRNAISQQTTDITRQLEQVVGSAVSVPSHSATTAPAASTPTITASRSPHRDEEDEYSRELSRINEREEEARRERKAREAELERREAEIARREEEAIRERQRKAEERERAAREREAEALAEREREKGVRRDDRDRAPSPTIERSPSNRNETEQRQAGKNDVLRKVLLKRQEQRYEAFSRLPFVRARYSHREEMLDTASSKLEKVVETSNEKIYHNMLTDVKRLNADMERTERKVKRVVGDQYYPPSKADIQESVWHLAHTSPPSTPPSRFHAAPDATGSSRQRSRRAPEDRMAPSRSESSYGRRAPAPKQFTSRGEEEDFYARRLQRVYRGYRTRKLLKDGRRPREVARMTASPYQRERTTGRRDDRGRREEVEEVRPFRIEHEEDHRGTRRRDRDGSYDRRSRSPSPSRHHEHSEAGRQYRERRAAAVGKDLSDRFSEGAYSPSSIRRAGDDDDDLPAFQQRPGGGGRGGPSGGRDDRGGVFLPSSGGSSPRSPAFTKRSPQEQRVLSGSGAASPAYSSDIVSFNDTEDDELADVLGYGYSKAKPSPKSGRTAFGSPDSSSPRHLAPPGVQDRTFAHPIGDDHDEYGFDEDDIEEVDI